MWLIDPDGRRFFSFGVCCVDQGPARDSYQMENPAYAAWQHYASSNEWAEATLGRLHSWGVTTIGGWSEFGTLQPKIGHRFALTPVLHVGSTAGAPWWDMWASTNLQRMHKVARDQILPLRDNSRVLGYYSDNEMGWWNAALLKLTMEQSPASPQRRQWIDLLRQTYRDDWNLFLQDFDAAPLQSWEELERCGQRLYLRAGGAGIVVARQFLGRMAERYYALMKEILLQYDPGGLVLGDRYQSFYYPEVAKAAATQVDAISSNLNAPWNDGTFPRYYLPTLRALTGKPIFVSEFYMAARENRSGNLNPAGFPVTATQAERTRSCRQTLLSLLRSPAVVGADWFQYYDEPTHGRADGENFSFGLVDIHNQPYQTITAMLAAHDWTALRQGPLAPRSDASGGIPPAPDNPLGQFEASLALMHWDRERGFVPPASPLPLADLYVCWNKDALFLGLCGQDIAEPAFYRDSTIPEVDRAEWTISLGGMKEPIRLRIGAGRKPSVNLSLPVASFDGTNPSGHMAAVEVPYALWHQDRLRAGERIELSSTFVGHARQYPAQWRGAFYLAGD